MGQDGPWGVEGGQGSWARLLSRQLCWICGNCCRAGAGERALSHLTSTLPGVRQCPPSSASSFLLILIILILPAHPHHPQPAHSPSPSSSCPPTLTILILLSHSHHPHAATPVAVCSTEFICHANEKGLFVLWSTRQGRNERRFILGHCQGRAELRKTRFPTWQLQESEEQELG